MPDVGLLRHDIQALSEGDDASKRRAIESLKQYSGEDWANVPNKVIHPIIESLKHQLQSETNRPLIRQEIVLLLGNMRSQAGQVVPQFMELLSEGHPDGIREAAAVALGRIGPEASDAVDQLIAVLSGGPTLCSRAVRSLGDIGSATSKVRTALVNFWLTTTHSQNGQIQAALALCKLKIDTPGLLRFLANTLVTNQDVDLRKSAAEALSLCSKNGIDVVPALLIAAVKDKDEEVRRIAEAGLTQLRLSHAKASHVCSEQLKDSLYAEMALKECGAVAVPALIEALGSEDGASREKAARAIGRLGELAVDAIPALTGALNSKNLDFRLAAAKCLWNISKNAEIVTPVLVDLLERKWTAALEASEARRMYLQTVMEALWRIGPPASAAIPALLEKTKDKNRLISESALSALKEIAPSALIKAGSR
jgi:HEAT repeat protein